MNAQQNDWTFYDKDGKTVVDVYKPLKGATKVKESAHPSGFIMIKYKIPEDPLKKSKSGGHKIVLVYRGTKSDAIKFAKLTDIVPDVEVKAPVPVVAPVVSIWDRIPADWLVTFPVEWKSGAQANKDLMIRVGLISATTTVPEMVQMYQEVRKALILLYSEAAMPK